MKKQSIAIIGVIAFVLAVAVGYALFSDTITITGTATASGSFEVDFIEPTQTSTSSGYTQAEGTELYSISEDGRTLTVTVNKLDYPGAYVVIPVKVQNKGTIPAVLESLTETDFKVDEPMLISYEGLTELKNQTLASDGVQEFSIRVEWDENDTSNSRDVTSTFSLGLNYRQIQAQ